MCAQDAREEVRAIATSIDGRSFSFQASLVDLTLRIGGYVVLGNSPTPLLGQILSMEVGHVDTSETSVAASRDAGTSQRRQAAVGTGSLLGDARPFHNAAVRRATAQEIGAWSDGSRPRHAGLGIGELADAPGLTARLDASGFDRHSFLCGQSGSGKTYSMGVVLEQLLLETELRIVVLDPNSDYVRLPFVRPDSASPLADRYREKAAQIRVCTAASSDGDPLRVRVSELSRDCRAALLQLDPVADREEYAALSEFLDHDERGRPLISGIGELLTSELPGARELGLRAANLGVLDWGIWERGAGGSLFQLMADRNSRCLVVDLGSLDTTEEQAVVACSVLDTLWDHRRDRESVLIVIDEAHNVCPQHSDNRVVALAARRAVQIAGEGRKFGLYLLASTQRPQKIHENVLSQCDNLMLMRMNSAADLAHLETNFSFAPRGLLQQATHFGLGEALVAGKISPDPTLVRFGARITEEGGADVAAGWADPRGAAP